MKKLTAGIFATLLAVVSTGAANAEIASKGYVDDQVGTVSTEVDSLSTTVGQHTTQIAGKADKATTLEGYGITDGATKEELTSGLAGKVDNEDIADMQVTTNLTTTSEWGTDKALETKYPSNAAVDAAIKTATSGLPTSGKITEIEGDITTIEGNITDIQGDVTELQTDVSAKQDKNMGAGAANHIVTTDGSGNITSSATITQAQVSGLDTALAGKADAAALATKVDANEAITAGTGTKITYDAKGLVTGSSNLTAADIPALTTDKITGLDTELDSKASQTDLTALTGRVTTAEGDIDALQAPTATVATGQTGPVSGQTVYNAIQGVTGNVTGVTGRVDTLEDEMDTAQSDITELQTGKQDKLTGPVGSATQPVYVHAQGNVVAGTAYGSFATKNQVANADVADNAAIAQSKIANLVTDLAAKITAPATSETGETGTWVLTYDGTKFQWEDIARAGE